jgi:hypothetical protein
MIVIIFYSSSRNQLMFSSSAAGLHDSRLKPFKLSDPEYSQETYAGRFLSLYKSQNPAMFFLSHRKIMEAKEQIETQKEREQNEEKPMMNEEEISQIKKSRNIVASAFHPDTGEIIPKPMRVCSYSAMSIPSLFGFLLSKPTTFNIIFW